jgi:DNA modification methylase
MGKIILGDALSSLRAMEQESIDCVITSPPYYGLRMYNTDPVVWTDGWKGELGSEPTVQLYVSHLLEIFGEVKRVLKKTGTFWLNIGDTYAGTGSGKGTGNFDAKDNPTCMKQPTDTTFKSKSQYAVPERLVLGLMDLGFIKRNTIIWHKPSCLPSSAKDRFTVDFEYLFFFVKSENYYFEQQLEVAKAPGSKHVYKEGDKNSVIHDTVNKTYPVRDIVSGEYRNKRSVWDINPARTKLAHFATFPEELIETPILAGCPVGGVVLDPFGGTSTTAAVAVRLHRNYVMIEPNPEYFRMSVERMGRIEDQTRIFMEE